MLTRAQDHRLSLDRDGADWPNRDASRFVEADGLRWHVQLMGAGPPLLLVHGAGAATHSWRALAPLLAKRFRVIAPDMPGHGFSDPLKPRDLSLPGMARALGALLRELDITPQVVVGHSAGAAILARMCLDGLIEPERLISLNGALLPFDGIAGHLFPPMAKLLFLNPLAPKLFAWSADRRSVSRLLRGTGSTIEPRGVELYTRLFSNVGHVSGALGMMANWDLEALRRDLPRLKTPLALVAGSEDKAVPPAQMDEVKAKAPEVVTKLLPGLGHLAHEENPERVAGYILWLTEQRALMAAS